MFLVLLLVVTRESSITSYLNTYFRPNIPMLAREFRTREDFLAKT